MEKENELVTSLLEFLHEDHPNVRQIALNKLLMYSVSTSKFQHLFKRDNMRPIKDLVKLCNDSDTVTANDAYKALVNLTINEEIRKNFNDEVFLKYLIKTITNRDAVLADMACMLLSNVTKDEEIAAKLLSLKVRPVKDLSNSSQAIDQLADVFVRGLDKKYNKKAEFHFLASVFADMAMIAQGREFFLNSASSYDKVAPLSKLIVFTEHPNIIRRGGVVSCIKNCCFATDFHLDMLSEDKINVLPYILLPLCGPEEFDNDDMEGMPDDIQFLPPNKKREPDSHLKRTLLESIVLLTSTRQGRDILRKKKVYPVLRQMHLVENDEQVGDVIEQIVNMIMRDEAPDDRDHDDYKIIEI
ncbi:15518_t:CDS:2 [Funneliformis geosporum]|uniref:Protein HGH1 homolog n=1 Tax=Funneliformis geosporum TaxID=1117311 RepID=A0A9W4WI17_9GLOM|nr:15518_t:CDS:2 [Funneliformis geosporum]CAI2163257.1 7327_t:CDS:2 [Funneliformis geosporum]